MHDVRIAAIAVTLALLGCASSHRKTPYEREMLDARTRGAAPLAIEAAQDPAIRTFVEQAGYPDYVLVTGPSDTELVYYQASRLVHFHRGREGTERGELTPLPLEVVNVLPVDLRAGKPERIDRELAPVAGCWHVALAADTCRTCCRSARACSTDCRPSGRR